MTVSKRTGGLHHSLRIFGLEGRKKEIDGVECVMIEPDIDYYKDPAAHVLLEVLVNALTQTLTDPAEVYVLRWIAGQTAGVPEFAPLYTIR